MSSIGKKTLVSEMKERRYFVKSRHTIKLQFLGSLGSETHLDK